MKCMFNPDIECSVYDAQKELTYTPNPDRILEKACPICPKRTPRPEK